MLSQVSHRPKCLTRGTMGQRDTSKRKGYEQL